MCGPIIEEITMSLKSIVLPLMFLGILSLGHSAQAAQTARGKPEKKPAEDGQWPGWLGPNRDGKSPDKGLLKQWPDGGPKLAWKATGIGKGYSSVAVANGMVYITGDEDKSLMISAFDLDGNRKWKVERWPGLDRRFTGGAVDAHH